jgi:hypothetical protein
MNDDPYGTASLTDDEIKDQLAEIDRKIEASTMPQYINRLKHHRRALEAAQEERRTTLCRASVWRSGRYKGVASVAQPGRAMVGHASWRHQAEQQEAG